MKQAMYRGKCTATTGEFANKMVYGDLIHSHGKQYIHPRANKIFIFPGSHIGRMIILHEVNPETVGQSIGVHDDENNEELYTGDNIKMTYQGDEVTGNIQYCGGGCILASDDFEDGFMWIADLTENDGRYFWIPTAVKIGGPTNGVEHA